MKKQLLVLLFFFSAVAAYSQHTITGVVTSSEDGMPVIGASVVVKGNASLGTITDIDGNYSIKAPDNSTLVFSYVGMETQEVKAGKQSVINVVMKPSSIMVDEVVVTAMGVKTEKKKLNFAVQSLDSDEIVAGQSANFVNSLQGKIAGIQTSSTGGSPNASSPMIIRAISSINPGQSNEPLFIVDGMPVSGGGTAAGDINPNDIESMTVLKGAAAAALYGQEASNGAIMITTKSGKSGKITVNANASVQIDNAVRAPEIQSLYGPGAQGFYKDNTVTGGWGPLLSPGQKVYDNVGSFLGTGFYQKYDVSASGGTDKFSAYASANYSKSDGVVHDDYKDRMGFLIKANYDVSKWVKMSLSANIMESKSRGFGNSMLSVYRWPINDQMSYYKDANGIRWLLDKSTLTDDELKDLVLNPNWSRYEDYGVTESTRNILMGSIEWTPVKDLMFSGKISYDKKHTMTDSYMTPRFDKSDFTNPDNIELTNFGQYTFSPNRNQLLTVQLLGTYKLTVAKDYDIDLLAGFEYKDTKGIEAQLGGADFVLPGEFYSMQNVGALTSDASFDYNTNLYHYRQNKFGYFGEVRLGYKGLAQLSATVRRDMSSTLTTKSYIYPSVTAGIIFSELLNLSSSVFSFGKIRGNWAKVGKDGPRYKFDRNFKQWSSFPDGGFGLDSTVGASNELLPEMTKSWEIGADLRFFDSRTRLDVAYYSTTVDNQIVTVRVSPASGMILQTRNEGAVKNYGVEVQFSQDILSNRDFKWTAGLNFSLNRGKVTSLPEGMTELQGTQFGDIFPTAYLNHSTTSITGKDYKRNPEGKIICKEDGTPIIDSAKGVLIGDRAPDFLLGLVSSFSWKNFSMSFLLDGRKGGDIVNVTGRGLFSNGQHKSYEKYRNREIVVDGVIEQPDGTYIPNTKPIIFNQTNMNTYFYGVSSNFIEDGSYIRLSYLSFAYNFTPFLKKSLIKGLKLTVTGNNLFLLTKYSGSDPQISGNSSASGTGSFGIDNYAVPSTRSFNFTLNATF